jgi:hypothetical protein
MGQDDPEPIDDKITISRRIRWVGYVARMREIMSTIYKSENLKGEDHLAK